MGGNKPNFNENIMSQSSIGRQVDDAKCNTIEQKAEQPVRTKDDSEIEQKILADFAEIKKIIPCADISWMEPTTEPFNPNETLIEQAEFPLKQFFQLDREKEKQSLPSWPFGCDLFLTPDEGECPDSSPNYMWISKNTDGQFYYIYEFENITDNKS